MAGTKTESKNDNIFLGFLSIEKSKENDRYIGAILVTDRHGVPQEFRCTHPVKPTAIQKPLYGRSLVPYISIELCGKPLLQSVRHKLSCLFVNSGYLIGLRRNLEIPVLFVRRSGKELEVEKDDSEKTYKKKIESKASAFDPITVETQDDYKDDYDKMLSLLGNNIKSFDLVEPFSRIQKTTETLSKQDERFQ